MNQNNENFKKLMNIMKTRGIEVIKLIVRSQKAIQTIFSCRIKEAGLLSTENHSQFKKISRWVNFQKIFEKHF